jgi:NitT/TauT family transport system permease protein
MASEAVTSEPHRPVRTRYAARRFADAALLPASFIILLAAWEICVRWFDVPIFIVPAPSRVFQSLLSMTTSGLLLSQFLITFTEAVAGFSIAIVFAAMLAVTMTEWKLAERLLYPYLTALQSMPKVAIAPLIVIWFGYGLPSKIVVAALLSFFPMLVSFVEGLKATDEGRLKLMHAMSATRWQTLRYVRIPYSLPFVFAGVELGGLYAMLGAIVAEFVGASAGIGNWLIAMNVNLDTASTFALLVVLSIYGIVFQKLIGFARSRALFWARRPPSGTSAGRP